MVAKPANTVKTAVKLSEPEAAPADRADTAPAATAAKIAVKTKVDPVVVAEESVDGTAKISGKVKTVAAKLPVEATVTAPSADADLAAATAKLDGLDTAAEAPPLAADPDTATAGIATANEGDGGGTEVTPEQMQATKAAAARSVETPVVETQAPVAPVIKAKAVAKPVVATGPATQATSDAAATTQSSAEVVAGNTHLAALTVPANPAPSKNCKVFTASYGGGMSLLIRSPDGDRTKFTALTVNEAKADAQANAFINVYAKGGQKIASFGTQNEALTKAFELCPEG